MVALKHAKYKIVGVTDGGVGQAVYEGDCVGVTIHDLINNALEDVGAIRFLGDFSDLEEPSLEQFQAACNPQSLVYYDGYTRYTVEIIGG